VGNLALAEGKTIMTPQRPAPRRTASPRSASQRAASRRNAPPRVASQRNATHRIALISNKNLGLKK